MWRVYVVTMGPNERGETLRIVRVQVVASISESHAGTANAIYENARERATVRDVVLLASSNGDILREERGRGLP